MRTNLTSTIQPTPVAPTPIEGHALDPFACASGTADVVFTEANSQVP
jgi:hypothetical protein